MNLIKLLIEYYRIKYPYLILNEVDDTEYIVAVWDILIIEYWYKDIISILIILGKMSRDFSKAKIYKITNDYNDDIYIGSTCNTLGRRFNVHKADMTKKKNRNALLYKLMNEIGFERFRIQLIIDYPCEDQYQLTQKEGEYIRLLGTLIKELKVEQKMNGMKQINIK